MAETLLPEFRVGKPDVGEALDITVRAYEAMAHPLGEEQGQSLEQDFKFLTKLAGYDGRLYVEPPKDVKFDDIVRAIDRQSSASVPKIYGDARPPKRNEDQHAPELLETHLAVFNTSETDDVDGLLHFLGIPYMDVYRERPHQTQLKAIEGIQKEVDSIHPQAILRPLGHRAIAMMILMDTIREIDPRSDDFILNTGGMLRLSHPERISVHDQFSTTDVYALNGRFFFGNSSYTSYPNCGVGLTIGLKNLSAA
ncbi:MAG TPA: hypothetical protein VD947_04620 [Patescibacteria group bacterium]|nr:hypothetical protein [Patescibacteria group bacterium]